MAIIHARKNGESGSVIGITTDAYVDALDWNIVGLGAQTIIVANTDVANALHYKILVRADYSSGIDAEAISETVILAGDSEGTVSIFAGARAKVQVKSVIAGTPANFQVDYIGMPGVL